MSSPVYKPLPPHTHGTADIVGVYSVPKLPPRLDDYPDSFWQGDKGRSKFESQFIIADLIMDLTITAQQIANQTIIGDKIVDLTITAQQIANQTIVGTKIADLTITAQQIANQTIVGDKIADLTITAQQIANQSIVGDKIAGLTITAAKIANQTIIGDKIADLTITARQIANQTITGANIANFTIEGTNIKNATITAIQIANATIKGYNIDIGQITASHIEDLTITGQKIAIGAIISEKIEDLAITGAKVAVGAITAEKIGEGAVTAIKILGQAVSIDKLAPNITSKTIEFLYIKFKEFTTSQNPILPFGTWIWTRELLGEPKLRFRLRRVYAELKGSVTQGVIHGDVYAVREGEVINIVDILRSVSSPTSWWSITNLGSGSSLYSLSAVTGKGRKNWLGGTGAYPITISKTGGAYSTYKIYHDYVNERKWKRFAYFGVAIDQSGSTIDCDLRFRFSNETDETNSYYFDVNVKKTSDHFGVTKKFSEMSTTGTPSLGSIKRISVENLTANFDGTISIGHLVLCNLPFFILEVKAETSYLERWSDINLLCSENQNLRLYYFLGAPETVPYLEYPGSDVRGVSYLEAVD